MEDYKVVDTKNNMRLGTIQAANYNQAITKAKAMWPENYPYIKVSLK